MSILCPLFCLSSFVSYSHNFSVRYFNFFFHMVEFFLFHAFFYLFFLSNASWFIVISLEPSLLLLLIHIFSFFFLFTCCCCCNFDVLLRFTCRKWILDAMHQVVLVGITFNRYVVNERECECETSCWWLSLIVIINE